MIDAYVIKQEDFALIPMAYNNFYYDICTIRKTGSFESPISIRRAINEGDIEIAIRLIMEIKNHWKDMTVYVLDMRDIANCSDRALGRLLELSDVAIIIISDNPQIMTQAKEDLGKQTVVFGETAVGIGNEVRELYEKFRLKIELVYTSEIKSIVSCMTKCVKKEELESLRPLDSSGVYCNMYVNAKLLFAEPDMYLFIMYQMLKEVERYKENIDALICASRNGANLATLIGWLLNIKVVYCENLGPRFALFTEVVRKEIRKRKRYFFIFDFMCLGTELKVLNTIIGIKGARLVGGIGIANYIDIQREEPQTVLSKMKTLLNLQGSDIDYKIAGTKEEIGRLLVKEKIYESRLLRL